MNYLFNYFHFNFCLSVLLAGPDDRKHMLNSLWLIAKLSVRQEANFEATKYPRTCLPGACIVEGSGINWGGLEGEADSLEVMNWVHNEIVGQARKLMVL